MLEAFGASHRMAPLAEVVTTLLAQCSVRSTGVRSTRRRDQPQAGLLADVELLAKTTGVPFTTLRETVDELSRHFGLKLDKPTSWDDWASQTVEANASSSIFSEDDTLAQQLHMQHFSPPT